jgi:transmembrane sensor
MSPPRKPTADETLDLAVDWVMRLESPHLGESDWLAFDAWLSENAENAAAYDRALGVFSDVRTAAGSMRAPTAAVIPFPKAAAAPPKPPRRGLYAGLAAAAAAVVALLAVPAWQAARPTVYETRAGERRTVTLKDGSRVDLNGATRLAIHYPRGQRVATLDGEAVFDVAKDPERPFLITAGDRRVRVVGTQFDVRRREGRLSVVVARGVVEVAPVREAVGPTLRLTAGHRLDHIEGAADGQVSAVVPAEALGWRTGRLIYRDAPMTDVVADLNAQFERPMTLSDGAGALRFSGVLILDDQSAVVRRLSQLAPITSTATQNEIVLRSETSAH